MPITFGSVGDIISLSLLIKDLVRTLDNSRGSSAEYQAVIRELWSLDHALLEVEALTRSCEQTAQLNALNATANQCAEQCRKCITRFHEHVKKFGKSLQPGGSGNLIRDTASKLRWPSSEKELAKFRAEINAHCFSINMLLTTTGVAIANMNHDDLQASLKQSQSSSTKLSTTQISELADIKSRLEENNALINTAVSETKALSSWFDMNYFRTLRADFLFFMEKIWKLNFLTYKAVVSLQTSIPAQLERCWTQEPATLEDALGRVTPIHLEFLDCWEAFEAVLEVRFRQLPGHRKVQRREYTLLANSLNKDIGPSLAFTRCFLPGQRIDMSMIFGNFSKPLDSCPGCKLATSGSEQGFGSQVQCPRCKMWYQQVMEADVSKFASTLERVPWPQGASAQRQMIEEMEPDDDPAQFRRVHLRYWDRMPLLKAFHMASRDCGESPDGEKASRVIQAIEHVDSGLGDIDLADLGGHEIRTMEKRGIAASFERQSF